MTSYLRVARAGRQRALTLSYPVQGFGVIHDTASRSRTRAVREHQMARREVAVEQNETT